MNYRGLLIAVVFAALSSQAVAQQAPRGRAGRAVFAGARAAQGNKGDVQGNVGKARVDPLARLQRVLRLTEAQVVAIKALETPHLETLKGLKAAAKAASEKTKAAIDQGASATDVGNAVLAANTIRQTIKAANEQHRTAFNNVLTTEQQGRLTRLNRAVRQAKGFGKYLALVQPRSRE